MAMEYSKGYFFFSSNEYFKKPVEINRGIAWSKNVPFPKYVHTYLLIYFDLQKSKNYIVCYIYFKALVLCSSSKAKFIGIWVLKGFHSPKSEILLVIISTGCPALSTKAPEDDSRAEI